MIGDLVIMDVRVLEDGDKIGWQRLRGKVLKLAYHVLPDDRWLVRVSSTNAKRSTYYVEPIALIHESGARDYKIRKQPYIKVCAVRNAQVELQGIETAYGTRNAPLYQDKRAEISKDARYPLTFRLWCAS